MTPRPQRGSVAHAEHDLLLIAAHAAGDAEGRDLADAERLLAACPDCARLFEDLRLIAHAAAGLPAPPRPRDFRITEQQANRLRRRGWRTSFGLGWVRGSGMRTLAMGLTTLGIAGILLTNVTLNFGLGGSATAPAAAPAAPGAAGQGAQEYNTAASAAASRGASPAPAAAPQGSTPVGFGAAPSGRPNGVTGERGPSDTGTVGAESSPDDRRLADGQRQGPPAPNPIVLLSAAFLVAGLGLFALRRIAGDAPV